MASRIHEEAVAEWDARVARTALTEARTRYRHQGALYEPVFLLLVSKLSVPVGEPLF